MNNKLPKYDKYKPSGVEWLGEIPEHWEVKKLKYIANIKTGYTPLTNNQNNFSEDGILWIKPDNLNEFIPITDSKEKISIVGVKSQNVIEKGSILICCIGSIGKFGIAGVKVITNQQINSLTFNKEYSSEYAKYLVFSCESEFSKWSNGNVLRILNTTTQGNIYFLIPPISEQIRIAEFLDRKTAQIDQAIGIKEKQIALLKERRRLMIHRAVTRGINPDIKLKPSGVEWIGEIPEHWEVKRSKYLFDEINERSETGEEELLSVSHLTGVTPRSEKNVTMFQAEDYSGSKLCKAGDLVFNIMWAWMGALGVSDRIGIVSPSYAIYRQKDSNTFNTWYLEQLLTDNEYIAHYNRVSTGLHSSRLRFYSTMFFEMSIGFPPKEEQDEIVEYLKSSTVKIDSALSLKEREIAKLKEYKSVLINGAVTGKVKVG